MDVRFRLYGSQVSAVMRVPKRLRERGALAMGSRFSWPSLGRALKLDYPEWVVEAVGWEGTPVGSDLVIHVV